MSEIRKNAVSKQELMDARERIASWKKNESNCFAMESAINLTISTVQCEAYAGCAEILLKLKVDETQEDIVELIRAMKKAKESFMRVRN